MKRLWVLGLIVALCLPALAVNPAPAAAQVCVEGSGSQATNANDVVNVGGIFLEGGQTITVGGDNGGAGDLRIRILNSSNTMIVQTNPANPGGSALLTYTVPVPDTYTFRFVSGAPATITYGYSTAECNPPMAMDGASGGAAGGGGAPAESSCGGDSYRETIDVTYYRVGDGSYQVWGNCQNSQCQNVASINPNALVSIGPGGSRRFSSGAGGWSVTVFYRNVEPVAGENTTTYLLSVYNGAGQLVQDTFVIMRFPNGDTAWKARQCSIPSLRRPVTATAVAPAPPPPVTSVVPPVTTFPLNTTAIVITSGNTTSPGDSGPTPRAAGVYDPTTRIYVVAAGDNLYRISLRFNVSLSALAAANGIVNTNLIAAGQLLRIP
ncbi:MAG: LysM peptidoglycan-binding domain-containing protein [Anaerolineae bacterium]|nr:LysM peptidoglycan-binding domain-containing protein [Anaerolineae bacterium]